MLDRLWEFAALVFLHYVMLEITLIVTQERNMQGSKQLKSGGHTRKAFLIQRFRLVTLSLRRRFGVSGALSTKGHEPNFSFHGSVWFCSFGWLRLGCVSLCWRPGCMSMTLGCIYREKSLLWQSLFLTSVYPKALSAGKPASPSCDITAYSTGL